MKIINIIIILWETIIELFHTSKYKEEEKDYYVDSPYRFKDDY
jgi:hypothetical protein